MLKTFLLSLAFAGFFAPTAAAFAAAAPTPTNIPAPQIPIPNPGFNFKSTANFDDLRHNILELIGTSRKRVWLFTDYLTDGEIASALFLAKYRNLDVKVYLGRDLLSAPQSRFPYLRGQSVPVYLRPRNGYTVSTLLMVDQHLYGFNRDLNGFNRVGGADILQASPADVKAFVGWLRDIMENPEIAYPKPRKGGYTPKEPFQGDSEGSYNYDRKGGGWRKPPPDAIRELPRVPRWKLIEEMRKKGVPPQPRESPDSAVPPAPTEAPKPTELAPVDGALPRPQPAPDSTPSPGAKSWTNPPESQQPAPAPTAPAEGQ